MSREDQITIVTAVGGSGKYLKKFKNNIINWSKSKFFHYKKWIIFAHKDIFKDVSNIVVESEKKFSGKDFRVVSWKFPIADTPREEMLSSFIFNVSHIKTKYWIKLDCDVTLKDPENFKLPERWFRYTMNGHRWGYTKVKHDPLYPSKGHWLNRLDDWADNIKDFNGTKRLFPRTLKDPRHGHRRVCSFFAIYKTNWTKHLAKMCLESCGRMAIPSEDTLNWYCITRLGGGRTIGYHNFRKYFNTR